MLGKWGKAFSWFGLLLLGVLAVAWYNQTPEFNPKVERIYSSLTIGTALPEFELFDFDGTTIRLSTLRGKPVLLDFWASWCPPCRLSMPELALMQKRYRNQITILAVNVMENEDEARAFIDGHDYPLHYTRADALAQFLGINVLPTKVLLGAEGQILWAGVGHVPIATHLILERYL